MSDGEIFVAIVAIVMMAFGVALNWTGQLHGLYFRDNPAPGIARLGTVLSMVWIGIVLAFFADPSVRGVYVVFYLVLGYAVVKLFGQSAVMLYGPRTRVDAGERRNVPAGVVIAAFTLATGLIFGGSLWGEADPVGDGEGGWWIPMTFFLLGWIVLLLAFQLFLKRERGSLAHRIRRERSMPDARAAATFLLASGVTLTDAVSGDFWGWYHGLLTFGVLAAMLIVHEVFASWMSEDAMPTQLRENDPRRLLESSAYLGLAFVIWLANRYLDALYVTG